MCVSCTSKSYRSTHKAMHPWAGQPGVPKWPGWKPCLGGWGWGLSSLGDRAVSCPGLALLSHSVSILLSSGSFSQSRRTFRLLRCQKQKSVSPFEQATSSLSNLTGCPKGRSHPPTTLHI